MDKSHRNEKFLEEFPTSNDVDNFVGSADSVAEINTAKGHSRSASVTSVAPLSAPETEAGYSLNPDDYDVGKLIGYGSSAIVYAAQYKPLNKPVAVKMIELDRFETNQIEELRKEIQVMTLSKHPNILPVKSSFVNGSKLYITTPFLAYGSLLDIMKSGFPKGLEESIIATIMKQALSALDYLHKNGHIHRDVKAGNLLLDADGSVLIADFGVSSSLTESGVGRKAVRKTFVGTPCWMAPEVMEQVGYDQKADIWSFGITLLELANGRAPLANYPPMKVLLMTLNNEPPTLDRQGSLHKYSKTFKDMIDNCLQKDPTRRPTADKLLLHGFFKSAKKKQYLVENLTKHLVPVAERVHKEPRNHGDLQSGPTHQSWDFSGEGQEEAASAAAAREKEEPRKRVTLLADASTIVYDAETPLDSPKEAASGPYPNEEARLKGGDDEVQDGAGAVQNPVGASKQKQRRRFIVTTGEQESGEGPAASTAGHTPLMLPAQLDLGNVPDLDQPLEGGKMNAERTETGPPPASAPGQGSARTSFHERTLSTDSVQMLMSGSSSASNVQSPLTQTAGSSSGPGSSTNTTMGATTEVRKGRFSVIESAAAQAAAAAAAAAAVFAVQDQFKELAMRPGSGTSAAAAAAAAHSEQAPQPVSPVAESGTDDAQTAAAAAAAALAESKKAETSKKGRFEVTQQELSVQEQQHVMAAAEAAATAAANQALNENTPLLSSRHFGYHNANFFSMPPYISHTSGFATPIGAGGGGNNGGGPMNMGQVAYSNFITTTSAAHPTGNYHPYLSSISQSNILMGGRHDAYNTGGPPSSIEGGGGGDGGDRADELLNALIREHELQRLRIMELHGIVRRPVGLGIAASSAARPGQDAAESAMPARGAETADDGRRARHRSAAPVRSHDGGGGQLPVARDRSSSSIGREETLSQHYASMSRRSSMSSMQSASSGQMNLGSPPRHHGTAVPSSPPLGGSGHSSSGETLAGGAAVGGSARVRQSSIAERRRSLPISINPTTNIIQQHFSPYMPSALTSPGQDGFFGLHAHLFRAHPGGSEDVVRTLVKLQKQVESLIAENADLRSQLEAAREGGAN